MNDYSDPNRDSDPDRRLEAWLEGLRRHQAPPGLQARILAAVVRRDPFDRALDWLTSRLWRPVLAAALPVLVGFVIGIGLPEEPDLDLAGTIGSLAFVDLYEELDDAAQP